MPGREPVLSALASPPAPTIGEVGNRRVRKALRSTGLFFDYGAVATRLRSDSRAIADQICTVYRHFEFADTWRWSDVHVEVRRSTGLRRWIGPQVIFTHEGLRPFDPFPASNPLPMYEWGANWLIGERMNHLLLLHAGVVERDGLALVLPATPGSGKSTLTAALSLRGWRLLSDEFGAFDLAAGEFLPVLKPVALKNESIDVIQAFEPGAEIGPRFAKTRKGTVAHLAPGAQAVARRRVGARAGVVILPKWLAGSPTLLEPLRPEALFPSLAFNAFNYEGTGADAFRAVMELVRACPAWQLVYSDLGDAIAAIGAKWPGVLAHHAARDQDGVRAGAGAGVAP